MQPRDTITLEAEQAQAAVELARSVLIGLKVLEAQAQKGDSAAQELLTEFRRLLRFRLQL